MQKKDGFLEIKSVFVNVLQKKVLGTMIYF